MSRELTRQEKAAIRKLVTKWCANYDKDYGCLPLECPCYMLGKCWTGAYCRYFRSAVLPLDPVLERSLTVERITETRPCPVCGRAFLPDGRQRYCSPACAGTALREQKRAYMRRKRRYLPLPTIRQKIAPVTSLQSLPNRGIIIVGVVPMYLENFIFPAC